MTLLTLLYEHPLPFPAPTNSILTATYGALQILYDDDDDDDFFKSAVAYRPALGAISGLSPACGVLVPVIKQNDVQSL